MSVGCSSHSRQYTVARNRSPGGRFLFWIFLCFVTLGFYFWGKVRVDLKIHENHQLELEKRRLQTEVNDLRAKVQELMSYHHIVDLAKKRGLVILSAANQANLPVRLEGLNPKYDGNTISRIHYAGLTPVPVPNDHRE